MSAGKSGIVVTSLLIVLAAARIQDPPRGNEASAIGGIRAMQAGQSVLASVTGAFGTWECLNAPGCLRRGPLPKGFVSPEMSEPERKGYRFELITSEPHQSEALTGEYAADRFAFVAEPLVDSGAKHAYCGDDTGKVFVVQGRRPEVRDGRCEDRSAPLQ